MLYNYLKVAVRSLLANRTFSSINIIGLSIGIASSVLIMMVVLHEFSYDHFHINGERIFRAEKQFSRDGRHSLYANPLFAPSLKEIDPRVESYVRTFDGAGRIISSDEGHVFFEDQFIFADDAFFSIFTFPLLQGDIEFFRRPSTAIVTEAIATKYFGTTDVVGKTLSLDKTNVLTVVGVAANPPINSTIQFGIVASFNTLMTMPAERDLIVNNSSGFPTYVLLRDKDDLASVTESIVATEYTNKAITYSLEPLFENHFNFNFGSTATTKYAYTFLSLAALILLLALINYMNLTTARATTRAREVGVRKVVGARRSSLSLQFYFESAVTTLVSFVIALTLIEAGRPFLTDLLGLKLDEGFLSSVTLYSAIGILLAVCVIVAGSYPAIVLPSFKPVDVLKGNMTTQTNGGWFRKMLMIFQFSVSMCLAICAVVMTSQMGFLNSVDTGIDREAILAIPVKTLTPASRRTLKNDLTTTAGVASVTVASVPLYKNDMSGVSLTTSPFNNEKVGVKWIIADEDFTNTLQISSGHNVGKQGTTYHVLNETAASAFGFNKESAARAITMGGDHVPAVTGEISGIVSDFNYQSLRNSIQPLMLSIVPDSSAYLGDNTTMYVRLANRTASNGMISSIGVMYKKYSEGAPFSFYFLDDAFNQQQLSDERVQYVFTIFASIALVIACMGLFGLVTFAAERRRKELSIRKILGATIGNMVVLISSETMILLLFSTLIAIPLALYLSREWLSGFFYQTSISTMKVVVPVIASLTIALLVIATQGIKAALTNPASNLKND